MNDITLTGTMALTMSSREIAELTGKEHKNVMADIRSMLEQLGQTSAEFSADLPDSYGRRQPAFCLPKDLTITLVSGYSVAMRHRIVTRWQQLEAATAPSLPRTFAQALRLPSKCTHYAHDSPQARAVVDFSQRSIIGATDRRQGDGGVG